MTLLEGIEGPIEIQVDAIRVSQPIGEFFVASIPSKVLCDISYFDVRRMLKERDIETYLGIQRPLNPTRVEELQTYVRTTDACFPTAVILAIDGRSGTFDPSTNKLSIKNDPNPEGDLEPIYYRSIAKVLDGQHRIAGLNGYLEDDFQVNVSIFIDIDIEDQAYIFSTVNLAQTKVNKSLAYDLSELAKHRSPHKTSHNIAVALDQLQLSPFHKKIKRLGSATPGRTEETLTQATFVEALLPFISASPTLDRDILKRGIKLSFPTESELVKYPFREYFIRNEDMKIADILYRYFSAVRDRWPQAWETSEKGMILSKTNGFRALMRVLKSIAIPLGLHKEIPDKKTFDDLFSISSMTDEDFNVDNFKPGSSGEGQLYNSLISEIGAKKQAKLIYK